MDSTRQLFELQELDSQIDGLRLRLSQVVSQLGESEALQKARALVGEVDARLSEVRSSEKTLEWELQDVQAKGKKIEQTLYGGSVHNPKELEGLQKDLNYHKVHQREREDKLLALMESLEALQGERKKASLGLETMEQQWKGEQAALEKERQELEAQVAALEGERGRLAAAVEGSTLSLYESLRSARQGQAVAKVEGGMCRGCRISLPTTHVQRARIGRELVQCNSCGRILYVS